MAHLWQLKKRNILPNLPPAALPAVAAFGTGFQTRSSRRWQWGVIGVDALLDEDCSEHSDVLNRSPVLMILQCGMPWPGVHFLVEPHSGTDTCPRKHVVVAGRSVESWKTLAWVSGPVLMLQIKACHSYSQTEYNSLFTGGLVFPALWSSPFWCHFSESKRIELFTCLGGMQYSVVGKAGPQTSQDLCPCCMPSTGCSPRIYRTGEHSASWEGLRGLNDHG